MTPHTLLLVAFAGIIILGLVSMRLVSQQPIGVSENTVAGAPVEFYSPTAPALTPEAARPMPPVTSTTDGTGPVAVAPLASQSVATPTGVVGQPATSAKDAPGVVDSMPKPSLGPVVGGSKPVASLPNDGTATLGPPVVALRSQEIQSRGRYAAATSMEEMASKGWGKRPDGKCVAGSSEWLNGEGILLREPLSNEIIGYNVGSVSTEFSPVGAVGALDPAQKGDVQAVGADVSTRAVAPGGGSDFRAEGIENSATIPSTPTKGQADAMPKGSDQKLLAIQSAGPTGAVAPVTLSK